jgi:hypothetical protein
MSDTNDSEEKIVVSGRMLAYASKALPKIYISEKMISRFRDPKYFMAMNKIMNSENLGSGFPGFFGSEGIQKATELNDADFKSFQTWMRSMYLYRFAESAKHSRRKFFIFNYQNVIDRYGPFEEIEDLKNHKPDANDLERHLWALIQLFRNTPKNIGEYSTLVYWGMKSTVKDALDNIVKCGLAVWNDKTIFIKK